MPTSSRKKEDFTNEKIISAILALAMTLGLTCFAVTAEDAAKDLGKYGIMGGFPDGTLRLEQNVTRAQMTKMVTTALGSTGLNYTYPQFKDVAISHWAAPYIHYSHNKNIVGGFGNGLFKPEDNVTTNQAIKMVVRMLEYDYYWLAEDPDTRHTVTYPKHHLEIAYTYGLTDSPTVADVPATRGFVASLISRALDKPLPILLPGYKYELADGQDGREYKTLRTQLEN